MKINISFMRLENFKEVHPDLVERVKKKKFVVEKPFVYHLTKGLNVERQALIDNPEYAKRWAMPMEKSISYRQSPRSDFSKKIHRKQREKQTQTKLA